MCRKLIYIVPFILLLGVINIALAIESASNPDPPDGAMGVPTDAVLSWTPPRLANSQDVYMGTDRAAVWSAVLHSPYYRGRLSGEDSSFDPGPLEPATTYYWKLTAFIFSGELFIPVKSPVWEFTTGTGLLPDIDIDVLWKTIECGDTPVGRECRNEVRIENKGDADLRITALTFAQGEVFKLVPLSQSLPLVIAPKQKVVLPILFAPSQMGEFTDTLSITSNDPDEGTVHVALEGKGVEPLELPEPVEGQLFAEITTISGPEVEIQPAGSDRFICPWVGMKLPQGSIVATGTDSKIGLKFESDDPNIGDSATVVVTEMSNIKVDKFLLQTEAEAAAVTTRLKMKYGSMRARVTQNTSADVRTDMKCSTPAYVAAVTGTRFSMGCDPGGDGQCDPGVDNVIVTIFDGIMDVSRITPLPIDVWENTDIDDFDILETVTITGDGQGNGQRTTFHPDGTIEIEDLNDMDPAEWLQTNLRITSVQIVDESGDPISPVAGEEFFVRVDYDYDNPVCTAYTISRTVNGSTMTSPAIDWGCGYSGLTTWYHDWGPWIVPDGGTYSATVVLDADNAITESSETDNTLTIEFDVANPISSLPNLRITSVQIVDFSASPISPVAGEEFYVRVDYNYDNPVCTHYTILHTVNAWPMAAPPINWGCGYSGTTNWYHNWGPWVMDQGGTYVLTVMLDADNAITESSETDNTLTMEFYVADN
jgi:hypothetical protein